MNNKLYVGNIFYGATETELREMFEPFGAVEHVSMPIDRESGRFRGFAFVTFETGEAAEAAMEAMNDKDYEGRPLKISEARERDDRAPRGGGGGGGYKREGGGGGGGQREFRPHNPRFEDSDVAPAEGGRTDAFNRRARRGR